MPKMKSHKGTSKRIRITGSGKLRREKTHRRHLLEHKSSRRTRRLDGTTDIAENDISRVRRLLRL